MPAAQPRDAVPGRARVTRRALADIVRTAVLGSYGVTGLHEHALRRVGVGRRAIRIGLAPAVTVDVHLTIAYGLPVAEVARQVDSAIRYALRRALGRDVGAVTIHVDGLAGGPYTTAGAAAGHAGPAAAADAANPADRALPADPPGGPGEGAA